MSTQGRVWIRLIRRHRVERDLLIEADFDEPEEALREALPKLDLSQPMWLEKHDADWKNYSLTRFLPEHFVEPVPFDYMEVSYVFPEDRAKPSRRRSPIEDA